MLGLMDAWWLCPALNHTQKIVLFIDESSIHPFIHPSVCSFIHPFIDPSSFPPIHLLSIHQFIHLLINSSPKTFVHPSTVLPIDSINSSALSFIHSFLHVLVHSCTRHFHPPTNCLRERRCRIWILTQAMVSLKRIERFLQQEDIDETNVKQDLRAGKLKFFKIFLAFCRL